MRFCPTIQAGGFPFTQPASTDQTSMVTMVPRTLAQQNHFFSSEETQVAPLLGLPDSITFTRTSMMIRR